MKTEIDLRFKMSSAQTAWLPLLSDIRKRLGLEFIFVIVERSDLTPVYNILTMQHGGEYYVRQRESSAVLEVMTTRKVPENISWPITKYVVSAQEDLRFIEDRRPQLVKHVASVTSRPKIREQERYALMDMLKATDPQRVLDVVEGVMGHNAVGDAPPDLPLDPATGEPITHDPHVDIVNVHRMALESLSRLGKRGKAEAVEMAEVAGKFVVKTVYKFMDETDIVVVGLSILNDFGPHFHTIKAQVIHVIMDCVQAFSPPAPIQRPRRPKRLIPSANDLLQQELEAQRLEEERLKAEKEEAERLAREAEMARREEERLRVLEEERLAREALEEKMRKRAAKKARKANSKAGKAAAARAEQMAKEAAKRRAAAEAAKPKAKKSLFGGGVGVKTEKPEPVKIPTLEELGIPDPETIPIVPLPPVPGVTFRGISRKLDVKTCLKHSVAAIRAFVHGPFVYRELFYGMYVHEELADLCLVMQAYPDIVGYIVWTLDRVYSDGFLRDGRFDNVTDDVRGELPSEFAESSPLGLEFKALYKEDQASIGSSAVMGVSHISPESSVAGSSAMGDDAADGGAADADRRDPRKGTKVAARHQDENDKGDNDVEEDEDGNESVDPLTGKVIFAVSDITGVDVDLHDQFDRLDGPTDEYINKGDLPEEDVIRADFPSPRSATGSNITMKALDLQKEKEVRALEKAAEAEAKEKRRLAQEAAGKKKKTRPKAVKEKTEMQLKKEAEEEERQRREDEKRRKAEDMEALQKKLAEEHGPTEADALGVDVNRKLEEDYRVRYLTRPEEIVVLCFAMIANHPDVHEREKTTARKWLGLWDDATFEYSQIVAKGTNIGAI